jgi:hypothetical protein
MGTHLILVVVGLRQIVRATTNAMVQRLDARWETLDRGAKVGLLGLVALVAGAVGVRVWFMVAYPTAFTGFPDSSQYALAAGLNIFRDAQRPAGYPFFLRLVHHLSDTLSFTILVQHIGGVVTGVLLYKAVRRVGAPPWLGLLPAAVVFFGGTGLFLEHSLLADSLFTFLQTVGVYAAIRALYDSRLRWALLAGIAIGVAFWVKTAALSSAVLVSFVLLCAGAGSVRRRLLSAFTVAIVVVGLVATYVGSQYYFTGYLGYERQSAWDLYSRVATFVDCSTFTPPKGTAFLCPTEPVGHRQSEAYYQDAETAPAAKLLGNPRSAPLSANALLQTFSVAAIEHEPVAYAEAIARGLGRYVFPRGGEGYTPQTMREAVTDPAVAQALQTDFTPMYPHSAVYLPSGGVRDLAVYESHTRIQGPLLVVLLIAAIFGPVFLPPRIRWAAAIFTLTALFSITFAVAGNGYDARYAYPTFGPLAAGAAIGAWGLGTALTRRVGRRRRRGELLPVPPVRS